jgi:3-oxoacyl-[acyl-carrier protein] reductase
MAALPTDPPHPQDPSASLDDSRFSLRGCVVLVTGSTTGLGYAMAHALGAAGAKVALNYAHNRPQAQRAWERFEAAEYQGKLFRGSVIDPAEVTQLVAQIRAGLGPIDILVCNATPAQPQLPIEEYSWDFYQSMLDFFIKSPFLLTRATLAHMKQQRWGRIINIGSEVFQIGRPDFSAYVAAKGGQNGWTRSMSTELAPWGITVNMISPGWIPVQRHQNDPQEQKETYLATVPAGRWGVPDDLAGLVTLLASNASSFISGQNICVNGGLTVA